MEEVDGFLRNSANAPVELKSQGADQTRMRYLRRTLMTLPNFPGGAYK